MVTAPTKLQPCRYLGADDYCGYWDMQLLGDEDLKCYPGGWTDCYEEPGPFGSIVFEDVWMTKYQAVEYYDSLADADPLALTVAYLDTWGCDRATLRELMRIDNLPEMNS